MRLSIARFKRVDKEFSATAVARTSAGPRSGRTGRDSVWTDQLDDAFEQGQRPAHTIGRKHSNGSDANRDESEPAQKLDIRRRINVCHQPPARSNAH